MRGVRQQAHLSLSADGTQLRKEVLNGTEYIVIPCVSKIGDNVEWPVNSEWPVFIPSDVLALATDNRNYRPVVLNHPQDEQGNYVSANSPAVLDKYSFGFVFGASFVDNKIHCEMWLDRARATIVGPDAVKVIDRLESGEKVEVSEGNFVLYERTEGEWQGKKYGAVWHACWSDHLATLPEGYIGACSINDGCGASALEVSQSRSIVYVLSALAQARTPTFSGTETSIWSKPSYEECIRYLYNGDSPPKSVAQCSSDLKRTIASHSLMGDSEANNFSDLTSCMCVSVSSGKLNERALRAIVAGRSMSGLSDSQRKSAIDTAQRLLNSEFSANLQTSGASIDSESTGTAQAPVLSGSSQQERHIPVLGENPPASDELTRTRDNSISQTQNAIQESPMDKAQGLFSRLLKSISSLPGVLRNGMSANRLKNKLWTAISDLEPGLYWVEDYDPDTKLVWYTTRLVQGDEYYGEVEMHLWQRSFTVDANENVSIGVERLEVEFVGTYKVIVPPSPTETEIVASSTEHTQHTQHTQCQCQNRRENAMDQVVRQKIIARLCASGSAFAGNEKALEAMNDTSLESLDKAYPVQQTQTQNTETAPQVASVNTPETVTLSKEDYADMKAAAECYKQQNAARRATLIASITGAQKGWMDGDLQALDTTLLEKLANSLNVNQPVQAQSTYVSLPVQPNSVSQMRKLPDTWGLSKAKTQAQTS